jgi:hypothetical protein
MIPAPPRTSAVVYLFGLPRWTILRSARRDTVRRWRAIRLPALLRLGLYVSAGGPNVSRACEGPTDPSLYSPLGSTKFDYWAEHEETLGAIITHLLVHEIGHHFGLSDDDIRAIETSAA